MKIKYGIQIDIDSLIGIKNIDLFLCAHNYEKRSLTLFKKIKKLINIDTAIALCYEDKYKHIKNSGIEGVLISKYTEITDLLDNVFGKIKTKKALNIVVDYSCMTKPWYYTIILYLKNRNINFEVIQVYFSYTPAVFVQPKLPKPNKEIGPLPGKYRIPTDKPKALIVGLGFERNKAEGIIEHLEPKVSYLFYTDPASDPKFVKNIERNNKILLDERKDTIFKYPYNDLLYLEKQLTNLYNQLKNDYSIIIAPLGPKPFTFISIILSVKYNDIDIWRVGAGSDINEYDYAPINDESFIICNVLFENGGL